MIQALESMIVTEDLFSGHVAFLKPWLGEEEVRAVAEVIRSGWICQGPRVMQFEEAVAGFVGAAYGVATNSCTSALHLSLVLNRIGAGDEVLLPSFTCMATANAVLSTGATPVFADVNGQTYNLDAQSAERAITARTRAVVLVHQIGLPADIDAFARMADRRGLKLIEDGACTLGGTYKGRRIGGSGRPVCFSFHPRKMITTGEGGMITTNDADVAERARKLRSTGASISDLERHKARGALVQQYEAAGYNYRMTDIQAAIGLVQMQKLGSMLAKRAEQAHAYDERLVDIDELGSPRVPAQATHAWSSYLVQVRSSCRITRDELLQRMAARGISCRIGIQPLHFEPVFRDRCRGLRLPATEEAARTTMFLPIYPGLAKEEQDRVIAALKASLARGST